MEVSPEYLAAKIKEYEAAAEQHHKDAFANLGAAQALAQLLKELGAGDEPAPSTDG